MKKTLKEPDLTLFNAFAVLVVVFIAYVVTLAFGYIEDPYRGEYGSSPNLCFLLTFVIGIMAGNAFRLNADTLLALPLLGSIVLIGTKVSTWTYTYGPGDTEMYQVLQFPDALRTHAICLTTGLFIGLLTAGTRFLMHRPKRAT